MTVRSESPRKKSLADKLWAKISLLKNINYCSNILISGVGQNIQNGKNELTIWDLLHCKIVWVSTYLSLFILFLV